VSDVALIVRSNVLEALSVFRCLTGLFVKLQQGIGARPLLQSLVAWRPGAINKQSILAYKSTWAPD
jgi:hypothetical protein